MSRLLAGRGFWIAMVVLLAFLGAAIGFAVLKVLPEVEQGGYLATPAQSASPAAGASGSPQLLMNGAAIPENADCSGCHLTDRGVIGLRPIPPVGHPLQGWSDCTACHAPERLASTAPGHTGIHATQCLTCHVAGDMPAPLSRPHRERENQDCLDCHGTIAPLPSDMAHRPDSVCWLCHRLPDEQPPIPAHETVAGETDCLTCHVAGKVGALPTDHQGRTASQCLLCHDVTLGGSPVSVVPLVRWPEG
jgi:hypothetical protein